MDAFYLTQEEDFDLHTSIKIPVKPHYLYEYFYELPLEDLRAYPEKSYHWWLGRAARSAQGLAMRDYVLHWRLFALSFRKHHPRAYLETLSTDRLRLFLNVNITKTPLWAYEGPVKDAIRILFLRDEQDPPQQET